MKLYSGPLSLFTAKVRIALDEKNLPYERIDVYDVDNGNRFSTYLIEGPAGSGTCCINGAAARLVRPGGKGILGT